MLRLWISDQPTQKDALTRFFRHDFPQSPPYSGLHPVLPVADFWLSALLPRGNRFSNLRLGCFLLIVEIIQLLIGSF